MKTSSLNKIHLFKEKRDIYCPEDSSILKATLASGINHTHVCGGQAKCSTCRVSIMEGLENCSSINEEEKKIAVKLNFPSEIRLACQTKLNGNISIRRLVADRMDMDIIREQITASSKSALGSQKKLTMLFTDIISFTSIAERFPPYDIIHILNRYYRIMNSVIMKYNGFISDIAGDGILAVFGTDAKNNPSVLDAIHAVEGMRKKLVHFNKYLEENFNINFDFRAGIHFGNVIVGPFDTGAMKKLGVIGDNVNYTSRIETANKEFGTKLLLSEEAYMEVKAIYTNFNLFETKLKGKTGKYKLYEIY